MEVTLEGIKPPSSERSRICSDMVGSNVDTRAIGCVFRCSLGRSCGRSNDITRQFARRIVVTLRKADPRLITSLRTMGVASNRI